MALLACAAPALGRAAPRRRAEAPTVVPIFAGELAGPMAAYRSYARGLLVTLEAQTAALASAAGTGDIPVAESDWLTAHLTWLRIGQDDGAYGAFGPMGRSIDGTAAGLIEGTASPRFTGFHRVELDLWTDHDASAAAHDAGVLHALVVTLAGRSLAAELPETVLGLSDWTLRCHEILEDALRDSLSGDDDYGSGTDLASVTADVDGTREMLSLLAPLIEPRAPHLIGRARRELVALDATAEATRQDGAWVAVGSLPLAPRERVDAAIGAALETLAPVPDLLHIIGDSS